MSSTKILLFTANTSMSINITSCLCKAGFLVVPAAHGIGALDIIHSEKPVLIILDMELPGLNSLAIIRLLRAEEVNPRIPVILFGANANEEEVLLGLEVGADLCLLEAFNPLVFAARVRSLIRRSEQSNMQRA
jgi:two-component system, OmpR family, alkaline phosphatase synthesis response regulator PhoP